MTQAAGHSDCVLGLVLDFGPVKQLPYTTGNLSDIYVVTAGGVGTVGLKSADQEGNIITFEFDKPLCVPSAPSSTATTFFFGLASSQPPKAMSAGLFAPGRPRYYAVDARAPNHCLAGHLGVDVAWFFRDFFCPPNVPYGTGRSVA